MNLTKTAGRVTALILTGMMLAACNGSNPFKGGSNPVKEYPSANEGQPYDPENKQVVEPPPDNTQNVCIPPMHVSINPDHGSLLMLFSEGEQSVYRVTVKNRTNQAFTVTHEGPQGSELVPVEVTQAQGTYDFKWTPSKSNSTRVQTKSLKVVFNYNNASLRSRCGEASVGVDLVIDKTPLEPQVSFINLPQSIAYQDAGIGFQVQIDDPASTQDSAPTIKEIGFTNQGSTGKNLVLDASKAVSCPGPAQFVEGTKWVLNCTLTLADVKKVDSSKGFNASFFIIAESTRNRGKKSIRTQATVIVTPKTGA